MNEEEIVCITCQDGTSDRWQCPECNRDIYEDRELRNRIAELERRLEESCAQNVADNYLVPALSQEVDDLKARNAELVEALEIIDGTICYNCNLYTGTECGMEERHQPCTARETLQSAIRAGKDV